jgi:SAM-dependent methyltransferase
MSNTELSMIDLIVETHIDLERQGPGSAEMTMKALSFIEDYKNISHAADLGCGTGGQTMTLAQNIKGNIVGLDQFPQFVNVLNDNAKKLNLHERVNGIIGSMENLPFEKESLDLIWSEGAIDAIGFEHGLRHWYEFLKKDAYVAVTCPSWFTDEHPNVVETFWTDAGSGLDTVGNNISIMQTCGYRFVSAFALPETCWTEHYFIPRDAKDSAVLKKYAGNKIAEEFTAGNKYEAELYAKYKQHYGYAFYIGKKI